MQLGTPLSEAAAKSPEGQAKSMLGRTPSALEALEFRKLFL